MSDNERMHRITLRIPQVLQEQIAALSDQSNRSINAQVIHMIESYIDGLSNKKKSNLDWLRDQLNQEVSLKDATLNLSPSYDARGIKPILDDQIIELAMEAAARASEQTINKLLDQHRDKILEVLIGALSDKNSS